jgi:peptidoglycan/LPS O-acetylase OafA/YrhL
MRRRENSARPERRVLQFDGLRGVAVLMVLVYHVGIASEVAQVPGAAQLMWGLKSGVTVFFVISGFLLYLPYARAMRDGDALPSWRRFAARRALRILPAYWLALTVVALAPFPNDVLTANWWRYYGLVQIYDRGTLFGGLGVTWSLCVEVTFYLMLPILAWAITRLARRSRRVATAKVQLWVAAALAFVAVALRLSLAGSVTAPVAHHLSLVTSLPGQLDWFAIGIALAVVVTVWEVDPDRFRFVRAMAARPGGCWLLAVFVFATVTISQQTDLFLTQYGLLDHVGLGIVAGLLILPAIQTSPKTNKAWPTRLLRSPATLWIGTISYGVYLWQARVVMAFNPTHGGPTPLGISDSLQLLVLAAGGTIALAAASWYLVEVRAHRLSPGHRRSVSAVSPGPRIASSSPHGSGKDRGGRMKQTDGYEVPPDHVVVQAGDDSSPRVGVERELVTK